MVFKNNKYKHNMAQYNRMGYVLILKHSPISTKAQNYLTQITQPNNPSYKYYNLNLFSFFFLKYNLNTLIPTFLISQDRISGIFPFLSSSLNHMASSLPGRNHLVMNILLNEMMHTKSLMNPHPSALPPCRPWIA